MISRRGFVGAAAAASAAAGAANTDLAVNGGKPVRQTQLRAGFFGTQYYDEKERQELVDVLESGRPFRWYGTGNEPLASLWA
jgi:hypothetical protein